MSERDLESQTGTGALRRRAGELPVAGDVDDGPAGDTFRLGDQATDRVRCLGGGAVAAVNEDEDRGGVLVVGGVGGALDIPAPELPDAAEPVRYARWMERR
jgi:hypothetical protein